MENSWRYWRDLFLRFQEFFLFSYFLVIYLTFYFSSFPFLTEIRQDLQPEWNGKIFNCARVSLTQEILRFNGQIPERNSA